MAFSLYAIQKTGSSKDILLPNTISAHGPLVDFCLQVSKNKVASSGITQFSLLVYILELLLTTPSLDGVHRDNAKSTSPIENLRSTVNRQG